MAQQLATPAPTTVSYPSHRSHRLRKAVSYVAAYTVLIIFGFLVIFPFIVMIFTSLKEPADTFSYPPRLLPRAAVTAEVAGFDEAAAALHHRGRRPVPRDGIGPDHRACRHLRASGQP